MKKLVAIAITVIMLLSIMPVFATSSDIPSGAFIFDDFSATRGMTTNDKPADNGHGLQCWWQNFNAGEVKNKQCSLKDGILTVVYGFSMTDGEVDTWGNWGEAFAVGCTDSTGTKGAKADSQDYKYFNITIKGAVGGEEKILIFNPAPEDEDSYSCYFDQLVLADGSHPKITKDWQTLKIDLVASKMPQVFNRFHIRSVKDGSSISLKNLYWTEEDGKGKLPVPTQNYTKLAGEIDSRVADFDKGPAPADAAESTANPQTGDSGITYYLLAMVAAVACIVVISRKKVTA